MRTVTKWWRSVTGFREEYEIRCDRCGMVEKGEWDLSTPLSNIQATEWSFVRYVIPVLQSKECIYCAERLRVKLQKPFWVIRRRMRK